MAHSTNRLKYHRWDLIACAWSGHYTFRPTGSVKAKQLASHLRVPVQQGEAWRCLRCGLYVPGLVRFNGPPDKAPIILHGKPLRQAIILRSLAVERLFRSIILSLLAFAIFRFKRHEGAFADLFHKGYPAIRNLAETLNYNLDTSATFHTINTIFNLNTRKLTLAIILIALYGSIELTEAIGLWCLKRWAEYFTVVATAAFLPLEMYELHHHATTLKVFALVINILAIFYLVYAKRLFGLRGGRNAYEKDLQAESLLEVNSSTTPS